MSGTVNIMHSGIDFQAYLAMPRFHKSMIRHILRSPKHLRWHLDHPEPPTADMNLGSLIDAMIFEPETVEQRFFFADDTYANSKGQIVEWTAMSKTCRAKFEEARSIGMIPIDPIQRRTAMIVNESILSNRTASAIISDSSYQHSMLWTDPVSGVECKGRPDMLARKRDRISDLKTTARIWGGQFQKISDTMMYHAGMAFYHDAYIYITEGRYPGENEKPVIATSLVVAEVEPPYDVICYDITEDSFVYARACYRAALDRYSDCVKNNVWPGVSDFAEPLDVPEWKLKRYQNMGVITI